MSVAARVKHAAELLNYTWASPTMNIILIHKVPS